MPAWKATWAINEAVGRCEVIRDGRPVGIGSCDDVDDAVDRIRHHQLYEARDRIVRRSGGQEREVDLSAYHSLSAG
ncbi:MAG TPA: hypothetical protein VGF64_00745 [Acidimicrobiales bacterium]|jgi:hypothetical protein